MADVNYDAHFFPNPIPLLRKASLYLPDNTYERPVPASPALQPLNDGSNYAAMNTQTWPANVIDTGIDLKGGPFRKYQLTPITRVGHQAYFLPWSGTGCATKMTLPNPPAANYFFTSALAGCSVIVTNTVQNPTIYHCGIESHNWGTGGRPNKPANVPAFWRGMINHIEAAAAVAQHRAAYPIIGEVNTELYVKDPNVTYRYPSYDQAPQEPTTQDAVDCMATLGNYMTKVSKTVWVKPLFGNRHAVKKKRVVQGGTAEPWGTFFGYYNGGQWHFYLQQNLWIKHDGVFLTGWYKASRRRANPVLARTFSQSVPWRIRNVHVIPLPHGAPVFTARNWVWNDIRDGNLWLP